MKPGALLRTNASGKFVEIRARTGEEASDLRETELGSVADVDPEQDLNTIFWLQAAIVQNA